MHWVIDYMEDDMWSDIEQGGDIWNGRGPTELIEELLPFSSIRRLTLILQDAKCATI